MKPIHFGRHCLILALIVGGCLVAGGCNGSESRETVNDTVETVVGKKDVDRYQEMKKDLDTIQSKEAERYRQLDQDAKKE